MLLERTVIRWLYGRPLETLLATWGISLGLIQTIRLIFGAQQRGVANPELAGGRLRGRRRAWCCLQPHRGGAVRGAGGGRSSGSSCSGRRLGLQVRAVTQNRAMAACMGVRTSRVDMWTFGLGSGIAGLGGVALSQLGNVGPELGQSYILDSFMVVVLGGVGRIAGTVAAALGLGVVQKLLEPMSGAVLGKIAVLVFIILFIQRRPQGMFALKGPGGGLNLRHPLLASVTDLHSPPRLDRVCVAALLVRAAAHRQRRCPAARRCTCPTTWCRCSGKFLCFAIVALAMDLIWGYAGILSLGHGLFFALGGYAMGMYLMRSIAGEGVYRSELPDFMVFLDWKELPWYWYGFSELPLRPGDGLLVPGLLAFVFGCLAFRSRIRGVYFSIVTQALTYAAMLLFFRNNTGFGGNNGLTDFKRILGYPLHDPTTRLTLYLVSAVGCWCWPTSPAGSSSPASSGAR